MVRLAALDGLDELERLVSYAPLGQKTKSGRIHYPAITRSCQRAGNGVG